MQTSINITSETASGKKVTKSISNINNDAGNTALTTAASLFTAISNTTYIDADRITKMSLTEQYEPKTEPVLSVDSTGKVTYNGDGTIFIKAAGNYNVSLQSNNELIAYNIGSTAQSQFACTIYASEGDNYAAKSVTFTKEG